MQERLNRQNNRGGEEPASGGEELMPKGFDQAILDEINNNPIVSVDIEGENGLVGESKIESELEIENVDEVSKVQRGTPPLEIQDTELMMMASASGVPDGFRIEPINSVFNVLNNNNDYVSQATGALTYE